MAILNLGKLKRLIFFLNLTICSTILSNTTIFAQVKEKVYKTTNVKTILYGEASYYAAKFNGRQTANGETFSHAKFTCACNVLPLGTWLRITNLKNGKSIIVKTNDRLHPRMKRIVDLTRAGAEKLGFISQGLARVKVEVLGKKEPKH